MTEQSHEATSELDPSKSPNDLDKDESSSAHFDPNGAPTLLRDSAFWGMTATQFLGAFNDNLFKQVVLLLLVAVPVAGGGTQDMQWTGTLVFSIPFILFSGFAGFLSDRNSKRRVIVASKMAEAFIMSLGVAAFIIFARTGLSPFLIGMLLVVLFCMGAQSAFFGPGKYGILPEMLRDRDLPSANGIILMTTFLAIIFGSALAGLLMFVFSDHLWVAGLACVSIAVIGTCTSLLIRKVPASQPALSFELSSIAIPADIRRLLRRDRPLFQALCASTVFWLVAAMVQMAVNSLGKLQLKMDDLRTSLLVSMVSIGIAAGSLWAGSLSKERFNARVMQAGIWGLVLCLLLLALPGFGGRPHLLGFSGSMPVLIVLGVFTGLFAVPLQVFLQSRPPEGLKGRMIATQNLLNWIGITFSAVLYFLADRMLELFAWQRSGIFAFTAAIMIGVGVFYRPKDAPLS